MRKGKGRPTQLRHTPHTKLKRRPTRRTTKPRIRLTVVKAIIQAYLQQARKQIETEEDGMDRLLRALRQPKPRAKKKKAG